RRRAARSRFVASHPRRSIGDGCDRRYRPTSWHGCGLSQSFVALAQGPPATPVPLPQDWSRRFMSKKRAKPAGNVEPVRATGAKEVEAKGHPISQLSPPEPPERIAAVEAEKAEIYDRMLRIAADFDNWKKRAHRDQADGEMRAKEAVLCDFLEIVDSLERATLLWAEGKECDAKSVRDG